ncbi:MAG TPA: DUF2202 domain-containing protein [Smithella sp.]|nr:DUF2202 domain-containing protein [Smithella sp.]MDM7987500.1 DUF2202 domain-containing protein [Smithella sp.]HNY49615.1 DUF2202 domain-containing protein [Smithella sp.]HOG90598.1 DUF2202 domain-containing protein [Smithella sp.]HOU52051.1 DUF2202 domain-containing protein [Smithella sp.]
MRSFIKANSTKIIVVGGFLLLLAISSAGYVQAATSLTAAEKYWLTYMREEEKLARDVYVTMYNLYGAQIFNNIAASEQRHMDSIKNLLIKYGIPDPVAGNDVGEFTNPDLQALYDQLIIQGKISLAEALKVGVFIEETDITDLDAGIASTTRKDIKNVYSNLLDGSLNHLKAFVSNLAALGITYEP